MENINKQDTQEPHQTYERFPFKSDLLKGLKGNEAFPLLISKYIDLGYVDPSSAKKEILIPMLEGKDLYAESEACLGKNLAIIIAALQRIESDTKGPQVIIIMHRVKLCLEALDLMKTLGKHMSDLTP